MAAEDSIIEDNSTKLLRKLVSSSYDIASGGGGDLLSDTSLAVWTIDGQPAVDNGTVNLGNEFIGADVNTMDAATVATPTHPAATVETFTILPDPLTAGSNALSFVVRAEDGVTTREYNVTLEVAA